MLNLILNKINLYFVKSAKINRNTKIHQMLSLWYSELFQANIQVFEK